MQDLSLILIKCLSVLAFLINQKIFACDVISKDWTFKKMFTNESYLNIIVADRFVEFFTELFNSAERF